MKKFLVLLTVVVLSGTLAFSEGMNSPFVDSLTEAVESFDLNQNGYQVDLTVPGQELSAVIQYEDGVAEVELGDLGRIQMDSDQLVYLNGGIPFVLDYSKISGLFQGATEPQDLLQMVENSLVYGGTKVLEHLINPFVSYASSDNGFSLHLDIDTRKLKPQIKALIADLIQDEAVKTFYPIVTNALNISAPQDIADLPEWIVSGISSREIDQGRIVGDLLISFGEGRISEIVFSGNYYYDYNKWKGTYPLYVEISHTDGKLNIHADLNTPSGSASFSFDTNHFSFETHQWDSERTWFSVSGSYDSETGSINGVIRDAGRKEVGWVSGTILHDIMDLNIAYNEATIDIYVKNGQRYIYAKVRSDSHILPINGEIWIGRTSDRGYSVNIHGFTTWRYREVSCALRFEPNQFDMNIRSDNRFWDENLDLKLSASYIPETQGIDITGEIADPRIPYRIHLTGARSDYQVELDYPYYDWCVFWKGDIHFSPEYLLQYAKCNVTTKEYDPWGYDSGYVDYKEFGIARTADTSERMAYQLMEDGNILYQLEMELQEKPAGRGLTVSVLEETNPVFMVSVSPIAKESVVPIDVSNAIYLTPDMIDDLIRLINP